MTLSFVPDEDPRGQNVVHSNYCTCLAMWMLTTHYCRFYCIRGWLYTYTTWAGSCGHKIILHEGHIPYSSTCVDQEGWRSTWQHCSSWGCHLCCMHRELRAFPLEGFAHWPLHWLSLCALYYSGLCIYIAPEKAVLRGWPHFTVPNVFSLGQWEYHYRWGWSGLNSVPLGAPGRHWKLEWAVCKGMPH